MSDETIPEEILHGPTEAFREWVDAEVKNVEPIPEEVIQAQIRSNVRSRVHDDGCEHCTELRRAVGPLDPLIKDGYPERYSHPEQLHSLSPSVVRAYERATGEHLDVEVRLYYQGKETVYTMSEERARALFRFDFCKPWMEDPKS
jgi:hypothetical protein